MSYHNRMMRIQAAARLAEQQSTAYRSGHRDARHAAAEIANEADTRIAELEQQLAAAQAEAQKWESAFKSALKTGDEWSAKFHTVEAEARELQAGVREWLCDTCSTVYSGPPQPGLLCVSCPKCGGNTGPRLSVENRKLREKLAQVLEQVRGTLQDAHNNAMPVCCGRPQGAECCGEPEPDWSPEDQRIMDVLGPIERKLAAALSPAPEQQTNRHEWDRDGERCVKCGDKDWRAGPVCEAEQPAAPAPEPTHAPGWFDQREAVTSDRTAPSPELPLMARATFERVRNHCIVKALTRGQVTVCLPDYRTADYRVASHDEHGLPVVERTADMPEGAKYRVTYESGVVSYELPNSPLPSRYITKRERIEDFTPQRGQEGRP